MRVTKFAKKQEAEKHLWTEQAAIAWDLKIDGKSLRSIGKEMGLSHEHVRRLLHMASAATAEDTSAKIINWKKLNLDRLEELLLLAKNELCSEDPKIRLQSIETAMKAIKGIRELKGLDAPTRTESRSEVQVGYSGEQVEALLDRILAGSSGEPKKTQ